MRPGPVQPRSRRAPRATWPVVVFALALIAAGCADAGPTLVSTDSASEQAAVPVASVTPAPRDDPDSTEQVEVGPASTPPPPPSVEPGSNEAPSPTVAPTATAAATDAQCSKALAGDPTGATTALADFDGDGEDDQILVYRVGEDTSEDTWRIRVETVAGESFDSPLVLEVGSGADPAVLGGTDIDGDTSTDEIFAVVGAGASTILVAIIVRDECELVQAGSGGQAQSFPVGGSLANIGGLECVAADDGATESFIAWTGTADFEAEDGRYVMEGVEYQLRGSELIEIGLRSVEANIREADFVYGQLSCGAVNL